MTDQQKELWNLSNKVFEKDGERFQIAGVWSTFTCVWRNSREYEVPHSMLKSWLIGAVEVKT